MIEANSVHSTPRTGASCDLDPKDVLADLFGEELPLEDPARVAEMVIERLRDAGFEIRPAEEKSTLGRAEAAEARCVGLEAMLVDAQKEIETLKRAP
jgi:hypothetical protein